MRRDFFCAAARKGEYGREKSKQNGNQAAEKTVLGYGIAHDRVNGASSALQCCG